MVKCAIKKFIFVTSGDTAQVKFQFKWHIWTIDIMSHLNYFYHVSRNLLYFKIGSFRRWSLFMYDIFLRFISNLVALFVLQVRTKDYLFAYFAAWIWWSLFRRTRWPGPAEDSYETRQRQLPRRSCGHLQCASVLNFCPHVQRTVSMCVKTHLFQQAYSLRELRV